MYDSVMVNGGSFLDREFVVYDRNQVYLEYFIWYKQNFRKFGRKILILEMYIVNLVQ